MVAPPNFEEGQSTYRPPRFSGQYYGWWKTRMHDFIMDEDSELWDVICDEPFVPTKNLGDPAVSIPKTRKEFYDDDRKAIEKNFRAKKILVCGIGPDEYSRISACQSTKEFWEALQTAHEGTTQYKNNFDKAAKRNPVLDKRFERKNVADNVVKQTLVEWGDSSSESEEENDHGDSSIMAVESEATEYDSIFALMAQSDDEETIENLKKENVALDEKNANIEHEKDDLMVVVVDLKETLECVRKEKEVLAERVTNIEHERDDLLVVVVDLKETIGEPKIESRPENSQKGKEVAKLVRVKSDLEKSLKWTWSADAITAMYTNNGGNKQGIGFQREKIPYNPHSKYVTVPDNWIWTHCGNTGHFKKIEKTHSGGWKDWEVSLTLNQKCVLREQVEVQLAKCFPDLDKGNKNGDLNCLSAIDDDAELWHRRLGHTSFMLLNKLVRKDPVRGLPKSSFNDHKVCDACVKGKQVRSTFKPKKEVNTSKSLYLLHMDLCGPMRMASRGGKKYIFVIVDDYSRFTWTLFLITKDETFEMFVAFIKRIQVKMGNNVVCIRFDHGTEFDNAKFDEFCTENGITHIILAPRTPQQNGVVEKKNRTLEDMAWTMLIDSGIAKKFWAEDVNTACYLEALGKFDAKSDEGIFLGYSSQSKAYKVYNKRTQCVEESIHVIFDESHLSCEKDMRVDQDGEPLSVPGEVINMANGKAYMMSHVKESSKDDTNTSSSIGEEPSPTMTTTEAKNRVVDAVQGTSLAKVRSGQEPQSDTPGSSTNESQLQNWKHKSSHPLDNIITPLNSGVQTRSKARNSLAFSDFLSQIEPKNIKGAMKDANWITTMQEELHQFERNKV
nr:uncharacterized protein LOC104093065 [Nicotiana tomentosiformis]